MYNDFYFRLFCLSKLTFPASRLHGLKQQIYTERWCKLKDGTIATKSPSQKSINYCWRYSETMPAFRLILKFICSFHYWSLDGVGLAFRWLGLPKNQKIMNYLMKNPFAKPRKHSCPVSFYLRGHSNFRFKSKFICSPSQWLPFYLMKAPGNRPCMEVFHCIYQAAHTWKSNWHQSAKDARK